MSRDLISKACKNNNIKKKKKKIQLFSIDTPSNFFFKMFFFYQSAFSTNHGLFVRGGEKKGKRGGVVSDKEVGLTSFGLGPLRLCADCKYLLEEPSALSLAKALSSQ